MTLQSTTLAQRTDSEIAAEVKARILWDIWINGDMVKVDVFGGKVTLTGVVGSAIAKSRASDDGWVNGSRRWTAVGLESILGHTTIPAAS